MFPTMSRLPMSRRDANRVVRTGDRATDCQQSHPTGLNAGPRIEHVRADTNDDQHVHIHSELYEGTRRVAPDLEQQRALRDDAHLLEEVDARDVVGAPEPVLGQRKRETWAQRG